MKLSSAPQNATERHPGPNLLVLTILYVAFLAIGGSTLSAAFHIPHDSAETTVAYMAKHGWSIQLGSFCELASAIPLGIFIATVVSRLRFLGVRAAGETIALLGGIGTTIMLMLSALASWSLTRPGIAGSDGAVRALQAITFAGGGPGFVVPFGLFIAGVSVSGGLSKLIPRWVMWLGIVIAIACELASLTLLNFTAGYFIPVGRFIGILWMIAVAITLPSTLAHSGSAVKTNLEA